MSHLIVKMLCIGHIWGDISHFLSNNNQLPTNVVTDDSDGGGLCLLKAPFLSISFILLILLIIFQNPVVPYLTLSLYSCCHLSLFLFFSFLFRILLFLIYQLSPLLVVSLVWSVLSFFFLFGDN